MNFDNFISKKHLPWVVPLPVATVGVVTTLIIGLAPNAGCRWSQEDVGRGKGGAGHQQEGGEVGHQREGGEGGQVNLVALTVQGEDNTIFICISRVLQRLFFCLEFHFCLVHCIAKLLQFYTDA